MRGHNEPGGGFIGGLLLALGIVLRGYITPKVNAGRDPRTGFHRSLGALLMVFIVVIVLPAFLGEPLLTGLWTKIWVPIAGKFSSVLVFDVAVYLVVAASALYAHRALRFRPKGARS